MNVAIFGRQSPLFTLQGESKCLRFVAQRRVVKLQGLLPCNIFIKLLIRSMTRQTRSHSKVKCNRQEHLLSHCAHVFTLFIVFITKRNA